MREGTLPLLLGVLLVSLIVTSAGRVEAAANETAAELYEDLADVIEEVVAQEATESAALQLMCGAKGLASVYPKSLIALRDGNVSQLGDTLRKESHDLLIDVLYSTLSTGATPKELFFDLTKDMKIPADESCVDAGRNGLFPASKRPEALLTFSNCPAEALGPSLPSTTNLELPELLACSVADAVSLGIRDDTPGAREQMVKSAALSIAVVTKGGLTQALTYEAEIRRALGLPNWSKTTTSAQGVEAGTPLIEAAVAFITDDFTRRTLAPVRLASAILANVSGNAFYARLTLVARPGGDLEEALDAARAKDHRRTVMALLRSIFDLGGGAATAANIAMTTDSASQSLNRQFLVIRKLILALADASLADRSDGEKLAAKRAALKEAGTEFFRKIGGYGFARDCERDEDVWKSFARNSWINGVLSLDYGCLIGRKFLMPRADLKLSWSNSYVNRENDGFRYVASIAMLNVEFDLTPDGSLVYLGVHGAAVDLLGPLSEVALRDPGATYENGRLVWANFFSPHVDLQIGFPWFSNNLSLFLGATLRYAAVGQNLAVAGQPRRFRYEGPGGSGDLGRHLELGLGVRYSP
ncbi:MAG: hypothetical protein SF187_06565 [Deltaproteobacteria bacterium]|nr:hypothetical protein [Deltaproteobacteria bacterium]